MDNILLYFLFRKERGSAGDFEYNLTECPPLLLYCDHKFVKILLHFLYTRTKNIYLVLEIVAAPTVKGCY